MKKPETAERGALFAVVGPLGTNPLHGEPEEVLCGDGQLTGGAEMRRLSERGFFARKDEYGRYENTDCKCYTSNCTQ